MSNPGPGPAWNQPMAPVPQGPPPRLASEQVVLSSPLSFAGSAKRLWKPMYGKTGVEKVLLGTVLVLAITFAWTFILGWYCTFGLFVVPWRLFRRHGRKNHRAQLRHQEMLTAMGYQQQQAYFQQAQFDQQHPRRS